MSAAADIAERLATLEDRVAIGELMQRYAAAADAKYTSAHQRRPAAEVAAAALNQAQCFTEDAVWIGGSFGGALEGRDAIAAFFCNSPWRFTAHHYGCASMEISGDEAQVRWRLLEVGMREDGVTMLLTGTVRQACRKIPVHGWMIARMVFDNLHGVTLGEDALQRLIPLGDSV